MFILEDASRPSILIYSAHEMYKPVLLLPARDIRPPLLRPRKQSMAMLSLAALHPLIQPR